MHLPVLSAPQRVHLNVLVNPHRPASPMRFFTMERDGVRGLALGSYIDRSVYLEPFDKVRRDSWEVTS